MFSDNFIQDGLVFAGYAYRMQIEANQWPLIWLKKFQFGPKPMVLAIHNIIH